VFGDACSGVTVFGDACSGGKRTLVPRYKLPARGSPHLLSLLQREGCEYALSWCMTARVPAEGRLERSADRNR
jgi:hypothetical protein